MKICVTEQENGKSLGHLKEKLDNYLVRSEYIIYEEMKNNSSS